MLKRSLALFLAISILLISCSSTTVFTSEPKGAKVFINDEYIGKTPVAYEDTKVMFTTNRLRIEKEGYKTFYSSFTRDEQPEIGAIITGFVFVVPFLWAMKYKPTHNYQLEKISKDI